MEAEPHANEGPPCARTLFTRISAPSFAARLIGIYAFTQVLDVAQALANTITMHPLAGTFNLPGPSTLTYEYLLTLVSTITYNPPSRAPVVPQSVALALAKAAQSVWWPMLSPDEVVRRYIDDVEVPGDWDKFGVTPDEIEEHAITYLRRYRSAYVFPRTVLQPLSGPSESSLINIRPRSQRELRAAGGFPCFPGNIFGKSTR